MKTSLVKRAVAAPLAAAALAGAALPASAGVDVPGYGRVPDGAYAVVAQVRAKPGKADALRAITLPLVAKVRAEKNNLVYFLHEDREQPGHFVFYEIFATKADFDAHNATAHVQSWFSQLPELADGGVAVTHLGVLNARTAAQP